MRELQLVRGQQLSPGDLVVMQPAKRRNDDKNVGVIFNIDGTMIDVIWSNRPISRVYCLFLERLVIGKVT